MSILSARLRQRLSTDEVVWLVTVRPDGRPTARPVWFVWDGRAVIVYSRPGGRKVEHLRQAPKASVHFDTDGAGGDVQLLHVDALVEADAPPPSACAGYFDKYGPAIAGLGYDVADYDARFTVRLTLTVVKAVQVLDDL